MGNTQSLCQEVAQEQEETVVPVEKLLGGESAKSPGSAGKFFVHPSSLMGSFNDQRDDMGGVAKPCMGHGGSFLVVPR